MKQEAVPHTKNKKMLPRRKTNGIGAMFQILSIASYFYNDFYLFSRTAGHTLALFVDEYRGKPH